MAIHTFTALQHQFRTTALNACQYLWALVSKDNGSALCHMTAKTCPSIKENRTVAHSNPTPCTPHQGKIRFQVRCIDIFITHHNNHGMTTLIFWHFPTRLNPLSLPGHRRLPIPALCCIIMRVGATEYLFGWEIISAWGILQQAQSMVPLSKISVVNKFPTLHQDHSRILQWVATFHSLKADLNLIWQAVFWFSLLSKSCHANGWIKFMDSLS
jgi:hypothetical protein